MIGNGKRIVKTEIRVLTDTGVSVKPMARLKLNITDEFMKQITAEAELLWPGGGAMAIRRLIRDSLRRLWRYCSGNDRA